MDHGCVIKKGWCKIFYICDHRSIMSLFVVDKEGTGNRIGQDGITLPQGKVLFSWWNGLALYILYGAAVTCSSLYLFVLTILLSPRIIPIRKVYYDEEIDQPFTSTFYKVNWENNLYPTSYHT
jgi:hypothetical protein